MGEKDVLRYIIERRMTGESSFNAIGNVAPKRIGIHSFNDNEVGAGTTLYRLKIVYADKTLYSNVVNLKMINNKILVYPNPVKDAVHISISAGTPTHYRIDIMSSSGQIIYSNELKNVITTNLTYTKNKSIQRGIYFLRITDMDNSTIEIRKLLFE